MSYLDEKRRRERALVEALHGESLPYVRQGAIFGSRPPLKVRLTGEPGWRYEVEREDAADGIFPWLRESR